MAAQGLSQGQTHLGTSPDPATSKLGDLAGVTPLSLSLHVLDYNHNLSATVGEEGFREPLINVRA